MFGILAVAIVLAIAFVPGLGNSILSALTSQPTLCTDSPYDWRCVCPEGQQKIGRLSYRCEPFPELPASYELPIETWEEAIRFSYDHMGSDVGCSGDLAFANPISGTIASYGYGVYTGTQVKCHYIMTVECQQQTGPFSGYIAWNVYFDPQTGHVFERNCNPELIVNCPANIAFTPEECYLPFEVCGDGECVGMETIENCPSDCGKPSCGDGICGNTKVQVNGCTIDTGERFSCAITGYKPGSGVVCSPGLPECYNSDGSRAMTYANFMTENRYICPQDCA